MAQLVLPQSIDAGTPAVASEVQSNFVATRDIINGQLEGGSGVAGNLKANGITDRELAHNLLKYEWLGFREGLTKDFVTTTTGASDGPVSPSSNMTLAVAAMDALVVDDTPVVFDVGMLVPVSTSGTTVTLDPSDPTNPRIDRIVIRLTGYGTGVVEVLKGTPTATAQTADPSAAGYNLGVAAIGNDRLKVADVLVPAAASAISAANIVNRFPKFNNKYRWADSSGLSSIRTSTTFGLMPHPKQDVVRGIIIDHEHAILRVTYFANWRTSVAAAGFITLMINGSQVLDVFRAAGQQAASVATTYHPAYTDSAGIVVNATASAATDATSAMLVGSVPIKFSATGASPANPFELDIGVMTRSTSGNSELTHRHLMIEVITDEETV